MTRYIVGISHHDVNRSAPPIRAIFQKTPSTTAIKVFALSYNTVSGVLISHDTLAGCDSSLLETRSFASLSVMLETMTTELKDNDEIVLIGDLNLGSPGEPICSPLFIQMAINLDMSPGKLVVVAGYSETNEIEALKKAVNQSELSKLQNPWLNLFVGSNIEVTQAIQYTHLNTNIRPHRLPPLYLEAGGTMIHLPNTTIEQQQSSQAKLLRILGKTKGSKVIAEPNFMLEVKGSTSEIGSGSSFALDEENQLTTVKKIQSTQTHEQEPQPGCCVIS